MNERGSRKTKEQTEITFRTWGGARRGSGRKPTGNRPSMPHSKRTALTGREPVLVTLKVKDEIWSLRSRRAFPRIAGALGDARDRFGMRIAQFSVQGDHVHLIIEAESRAALARGIKGFCVRIARAMNRLMSRKGAVFADRYHDRVLQTPRQTRHALAYVLCNFRKHGFAKRSGPDVDPCSSGASFAGWSRPVRAATSDPPTTGPQTIAPPRTWLLRVGWTRAGRTIDPAHCPGRAPQ